MNYAHRIELKVGDSSVILKSKIVSRIVLQQQFISSRSWNRSYIVMAGSNCG